MADCNYCGKIRNTDWDYVSIETGLAYCDVDCLRLKEESEKIVEGKSEKGVE